MRILRSGPFLSLMAALALAACGGGDVDPPDDTVAPTVVTTAPENGISDVPVDTAVVITFSEPMDQNAGTLSLEPPLVSLPVGEGIWNADRTQWQITPPSHLEPDTAVTVTVRGFRDVAGNGIRTLTFLFVTRADADSVPPKVVSTVPGEGALDVPITVGNVAISFNEPMDTSKGTLRLDGGSGTLGTPAWSGSTMTVSITGLTGETDYSVVLTGFEDLAGNALDGSDVLLDGALDFTTAEADTTPPQISMTTPREGSAAVNPDSPSIVVIFDEAMRVSAGTSVLTSPGTSISLAGVWSNGDRTITFDLSADPLSPSTAYQLSFEGYVDVSGNALDPMPVLMDGILDFTTSIRIDARAPQVASSMPVEGAVGIALGTAQIQVTFDEPMNATNRMANLITGNDTTALTGVWSAADSVLTFDTTGLFQYGTAYRLDLRGFRDVAGNVLNGTAYLMDGYLDFTVQVDSQPPTVVGSMPVEADGLTVPPMNIFVSFSERMRTVTATTVILATDTATVTLPGNWNAAGNVITVPTNGAVGFDTYRVLFPNFMDIAGNPLNGGPYLGDGILDFRVASGGT